MADMRSHEKSHDLAKSAPELQPVHLPVKNHHRGALEQQHRFEFRDSERAQIAFLPEVEEEYVRSDQSLPPLGEQLRA